MSKTAVIFGLFIGILFVYVFVALRQTSKNISKIEAFQVSGPNVDNNPRVSKSNPKSKKTSSSSSSSSSSSATSPLKKDLRTDHDISISSSKNFLTHQEHKYKKDQKEAPRKEPRNDIEQLTGEEIQETANGSVISAPQTPQTSPINNNMLSSDVFSYGKYGQNLQLKSLLDEDVAQQIELQEQQGLVVDVEKDWTIPSVETPISISAMTDGSKPLPSTSDVIADDEQRVYWIGNVLFQLMPDNGVTRFVNEVRELSERCREDTFGNIIQKLKLYVIDKQREEERMNTVEELVKIARELQDRVHQLPNSMVSKLVPASSTSLTSLSPSLSSSLSSSETTPANVYSTLASPTTTTTSTTMALPQTSTLAPLMTSSANGDQVEMFTQNVMPSTYLRQYSPI
jgi:hypothetical protein